MSEFIGLHERVALRDGLAAGAFIIESATVLVGESVQGAEEDVLITDAAPTLESATEGQAFPARVTPTTGIGLRWEHDFGIDLTCSGVVERLNFDKCGGAIARLRCT